ncbi:MAG: hypothetical protein IJT77_03840 [Clostridia bacterium]|nr:hypothetical protein [Clostridia bacterium]
MEKRLTHLFDYQRFALNPVLQSMIDRTESRYGIYELADDDLADLAAAGAPRMMSPRHGEEGPHR